MLRLVFLTLALTACKSGSNSSSPEPLKLGVVPAVDAERAKGIYKPFVDELSKVLGRPAEVFVADGYDDLRDRLIAGDVQLAIFSAYLYASTALVRDETNEPMYVLAQERRRMDTPYIGVFVVAKDNPAEQLADLKGKKIAYVAESSSSGYIYPRMRMRALGLDPDDFFSEVIFARSHDEVVAKVKAGEVDVGACSELSTTLSGLRILERTDPIPEDAIVSLDGLDTMERSTITNFLVSAHRNPALTNYFIARSIRGYVPAKIEVYTPQREEMKRSAAK